QRRRADGRGPSPARFPRRRADRPSGNRRRRARPGPGLVRRYAPDDPVATMTMEIAARARPKGLQRRGPLAEDGEAHSPIPFRAMPRPDERKPARLAPGGLLDR